MLRYDTICPHCGNEITVNNLSEEHKCRWCRRLISVKLERKGKKSIRCEVEAIDFPDSDYAKYKEEDIYGTKHNKGRNSQKS